MTSMRGLSRVVLAAKVLADAARDEGAAAKQALLEQMRADGVERARVSGETGEDFGTVVLSAGRTEARIVDEPAFTAWVEARHPDQVVPLVRPAFRDRVLAHAARCGDPVDDQGEVIPGVEIRAGEPFLTTRPSGTARERMRSALAMNGLLSLGSSDEAVA